MVVSGISLRRALNSRRWPSTEAEIFQSTIRSEQTRYGRLYLPVVRYRYRVGPTIFEGKRIAFGGLLKTTRRLQVVRYQVGQTIRVSYCPTKPWLAVLEPGARWYLWVGLLIGAVLIVVGLLQVTQATSALRS
jgi:hypothetical protein